MNGQLYATGSDRFEWESGCPLLLGVLVPRSMRHLDHLPVFHRNRHAPHFIRGMVRGCRQRDPPALGWPERMDGGKSVTDCNNPSRATDRVAIVDSFRSGVVRLFWMCVAEVTSALASLTVSARPNL